MVMLLVAAALVIPVGFTENRALEPAASYVAGKPAVVVCANTSDAWRGYVSAKYGDANVAGVTVPGSSETYLAASVCEWLSYKERGPEFAASLLTLVHESIHQRGVVDEGVTECAAVHETPGVAVRFFHVKPGKQLRALMALVWRQHATKPPVYRSVC